jgi:WD40 repeat protein/energy-coupling factor transporter ATP-binding protein EcfA2
VAGEGEGEGVLTGALCARFGRSHAVVLGVDRYLAGIPPLRNAVRDALQVGHALGTEHGFEVTPFFNERATGAALLGHLREVLPQAVTARDRVVLYVAAHGHSVPSDAGPDGHLLLHDARREEPETFLAMDALYAALSALPCPHVLVILDCCFAGAFRWVTTRDVGARAPVFRETFERFVESPAWQALTSAAADQLAFDAFSGRVGAEHEHSPFAAALLTALRGGADRNGDGLVTATDLYQYVRDEVELALARHKQRQTPGLFPLPRHGHGEFVFAVPGRQLQLPPAVELTEERNPYLGLASFDETRADGFFGRAPAIEALQQRVRRQQLVVVTGPSGTGKSSLVQAGLIPVLRAQGWRILAPRRPGLSPLATLASLADELCGTGTSSSPPSDAGSSWEEAVAALDRSQEPVLLVLDQLEELTTLSVDRGQARQFLEQLAAVLQRAAKLHLVLTVRADLEPRFETSPLGPRWNEGRFVVPPMTSAELRAAIEGPAHQLGMYFDPPTIIDRLLEDVLTAPAPLPLLSFALHEMYRARSARRHLDRAFLAEDHAAMGSVRSALTRRASAVHDALVVEPGCAVTLRNVMLRMVTPIGAELARRRVSREELDFGDETENARVDRVLEALRQARRISLSSEAATRTSPAVPYAEPAHDELVRGWDRLSEWWQAGLPLRGVLEAVGFAARAWQANDRQTSYLWTHDPRLAQGMTLADGAEPVLNRQERAFVRASAGHHVRRSRALAAVVLAVIAVLAIAALVAWSQRRQAQSSLAENQRTLATSLAEQGRRYVVDGQPRRALPFLARSRELGNTSAPLRLLFALATRELWTVEARHRGGLSAATYSPDGRWFATASFDGTARVWDAATGAAASPTLAHGGRVTGVHFSPDGARLVTTGVDERAQLWDWRSGVPGAALRHRERVLTAEPSPDGRWIVTASQDDTAQVWDAATGQPVGRPLQHAGDVTTATFSPVAAEVVTASDDGTVQIWSAATGQPRAQPMRHERAVLLARWSAAGDRILTVDDRATVRVWSAATGEGMTVIEKGESLIRDARFSPDGAQVLTASNDGHAELWDAASGKPIGPVMPHRDLVVTAAFSPDGAVLATGSYDGMARLWDAATGAPLTPPLEHGGPVESVELSPDGAFLLTASGDGAARIWPVVGCRPVALPSAVRRIPTAAELSSNGALVLVAVGEQARVWRTATGLPATPPLMHDAHLESATLDREETGVITATAAGTLQRWEIATAKVSWQARAPGGVAAARGDRTRQRLAIAGKDRTATLWDTSTGQQLLSIPHDAAVQSAELSADGLELVTTSERLLRRWDASSRAPRAPLAPPLHHDDTLQQAHVSASGTWIVAIDGNEIAIWSRSGSRLAPFLHRDLVRSAELDGAETRLVSASWDDTARLWDLTTGRAVGLPLQHAHDVESARWSRDGTMVVTASGDRTARVWDAATGQPLTPPLEHGSGVRLARFSPDDERVLTASDDGVAFLWDLSLDRRAPAEWRAIADRYGLGAVPGQPEPGPGESLGPLLTTPRFTAAQQRARAANLLASATRVARSQPELARAFASIAHDLSRATQDDEVETKAQALLTELAPAPAR